MEEKIIPLKSKCSSENNIASYIHTAFTTQTLNAMKLDKRLSHYLMLLFWKSVMKVGWDFF